MALSLSDPQVLTGIVCGIIVVILAIIIVLYLKSRHAQAGTRDKSGTEKTSRFDYQPDVRPIPVVSQGAIPRPVQKTSPPAYPRPKAIEILNGCNDITGSLRALAEKFSLERLTIATSDGLVFASSGGESAQEDAARYSEIFLNDPLSETPGITLAGISHKGSDLILIISTPLEIPGEIQQMIEHDTKDILNLWI